MPGLLGENWCHLNFWLEEHLHLEPPDYQDRRNSSSPEAHMFYQAPSPLRPCKLLHTSFAWYYAAKFKGHQPVQMMQEFARIIAFTINA